MVVNDLSQSGKTEMSCYLLWHIWLIREWNGGINN
jgi:hypothetical protein